MLCLHYVSLVIRGNPCKMGWARGDGKRTQNICRESRKERTAWEMRVYMPMELKAVCGSE
jgi:hypothetical protein